MSRDSKKQQQQLIARELSAVPAVEATGRLYYFPNPADSSNDVWLSAVLNICHPFTSFPLISDATSVVNGILDRQTINILGAEYDVKDVINEASFLWLRAVPELKTGPQADVLRKVITGRLESGSTTIVTFINTVPQFITLFSQGGNDVLATALPL